MLELTADAAEVVTSILSQAELPEGAGMRITSEAADTGSNGSAPTRDIRLAVVDAPAGDDQVYIESGQTAEMLDDKVLDAVVDDEVVEFRLIDETGL